MTVSNAGGRGLRFDSEVLGQPQEWTVIDRGLEYPGEVVVAETVNPEWGQPLKREVCFRVVLYTVPRRIPPGQIRDPRIAMAVPRRSLQPVRQSLGQEIQSIHEARERYVTRLDAETQAVRASMAERESSLRDELVRRQALSYAEGRIYTITGMGLRPSTVFAGDSASSWVDNLVEATMQQAFPTLPLAHDRLPAPITAASIGGIFAGLLQADPDFAKVATEFGPALGITKGPAPDGFDASGSQVVDAIAELLASTGDEMASQDMLQSLCHNQGLSWILATFYLLAFVRHSRAEVSLSPSHSIQLRSGGPLLSDRITWDLVHDLSFTPSISEHLGTLRARPEPAWNGVLPYASLLVEGLGLSEDAAEIKEQEEKLIAALGEFGARLEESRESISELAATLDEEAGDTLAILRQLQVLCTASGLRGFHTLAIDGFGGPLGLRTALGLQHRLERLVELAPDITRERRYLDEMTYGRQQQDLAMKRDTLTKTIALDSLIENPSLWAGVLQNIRQLRGEYGAAYLSHHAVYHQEAAELTNELEDLRPQVEALERFNEVPELGGPFGTAVAGRFRSLMEAVRSCTKPEDDIVLESGPICDECHLPMNEDVPRREAAPVLRETASAMREYNRRIGSEGVRRILSDTGRDQLDKLISIVQVSDLSALANVLDAEVLEFLRRFVRDS